MQQAEQANLQNSPACSGISSRKKRPRPPMLRWEMSSDVVDLRDFYGTGLGQVARRMIRRAVQRVWPDLHGLRLLGVGYATPFLSAIAPGTERTMALMPASLGVLGWPSDGPNQVTLADEGEIPFADYSIDRVLGVP